MDNNEIKEYIDRLNKNEAEETIFIRELNHFIFLARVWKKEPELEDVINVNMPSHQFFFIKNENGKHIGAIYDMKQDLHWYILEEERKKGFLSKALKSVVLPYLFYYEDEEREIQRISIKKQVIGEINYENSKKVAERLGFKSIDKNQECFELS